MVILLSSHWIVNHLPLMIMKCSVLTNLLMVYKLLRTSNKQETFSFAGNQPFCKSLQNPIIKLFMI